MFTNNFISNVVMLLIFSKYKNSNFSEILWEMKDLREIFRNIFIIYEKISWEFLRDLKAVSFV